jgi:hypothetical protein
MYMVDTIYMNVLFLEYNVVYDNIIAQGDRLGKHVCMCDSCGDLSMKLLAYM